MHVINIHQAKTNLSKLIQQVNAEEDVIIAKAGKPVAKLIAYEQRLKLRKAGLLKGKISIADNFDDEIPEINKLFYGKHG